MQHDMSEPESQPATPPPNPPFQFRLRTLLLLFVVLGSSLAVFGAWGIVVFALATGLAVFLRHVESLSSLILALFVFSLLHASWVLWSITDMDGPEHALTGPTSPRWPCGCFRWPRC